MFERFSDGSLGRTLEKDSQGILLQLEQVSYFWEAVRIDGFVHSSHGMGQGHTIASASLMQKGIKNKNQIYFSKCHFGGGGATLIFSMRIELYF